MRVGLRGRLEDGSDGLLVVFATVRHDLFPSCRSESFALDVGGEGVGILCSLLGKLLGEFLEVSVLVTLDRHALSIACPMRL